MTPASWSPRTAEALARALREALQAGSIKCDQVRDVDRVRANALYELEDGIFVDAAVHRGVCPHALADDAGVVIFVVRHRDALRLHRNEVQDQLHVLAAHSREALVRRPRLKVFGV